MLHYCIVTLGKYCYIGKGRIGDAAGRCYVTLAKLLPSARNPSSPSTAIIIIIIIIMVIVILIVIIIMAIIILIISVIIKQLTVFCKQCAAAPV